jgi:hypothetical protein
VLEGDCGLAEAPMSSFSPSSSPLVVWSHTTHTRKSTQQNADSSPSGLEPKWCMKQFVTSNCANWNNYLDHHENEQEQLSRSPLERTGTSIANPKRWNERNDVQWGSWSEEYVHEGPGASSSNWHVTNVRRHLSHSSRREHHPSCDAASSTETSQRNPRSDLLHLHQQQLHLKTKNCDLLHHH